MIEACGNAMQIADKALSIGRRQHTVRPHATRTLCKPDPNTIRKASPEPSGAPPLCHCPPPGHTSVQQQQRRRYRSRESRGHGDGSRGPASTHRRRVSRRAHPAAGRAVRARSWQLAGRHSRPELSYFRRLRRTTSCKSGARRATNPSAALPAARSGTRSRTARKAAGPECGQLGGGSLPARRRLRLRALPREAALPARKAAAFLPAGRPAPAAPARPRRGTSAGRAQLGPPAATRGAGTPEAVAVARGLRAGGGRAGRRGLLPSRGGERASEPEAAGPGPGWGGAGSHGPGMPGMWGGRCGRGARRRRDATWDFFFFLFFFLLFL